MPWDNRAYHSFTLHMAIGSAEVYSHRGHLRMQADGLCTLTLKWLTQQREGNVLILLLFFCCCYCFLFFVYLFFNWRKIALQCCVGFCHTTQYNAAQPLLLVYHFRLSLPLFLASHPPRSSQSPRLGSLLYAATSHQLSLLYTVMYVNWTELNVCMPMLLSLFLLLSPSPTVSTSLFSASASPFLPCK